MGGKQAKKENDFWDLDEQQLSLTNMEAELGRLKSGDRIDLLNVGFEDLSKIFRALDLYSGGMEQGQQELISKVVKMRDELMDALSKMQKMQNWNAPTVSQQLGGGSTTQTWSGTSGGTII